MAVSPPVWGGSHRPTQELLLPDSCEINHLVGLMIRELIKNSIGSVDGAINELFAGLLIDHEDWHDEVEEAVIGPPLPACEGWHQWCLWMRVREDDM
ncbi:hypothetical protein VNO77_19961 [Canavalia gladiata]|uniref:Uncharacterized protein n=1 Tax=Canavalia gladiata TaxID=3824 RepID=A0AAN9QQ33_CANGL